MTQLGQPEMQNRVDEILNRWPAVGLAFGVVRDGSLEFFSGHGFADIATKTPVTEKTVFRIGSITKTFTAVAALQLVEQGSSTWTRPSRSTCVPTAWSRPTGHGDRPPSGIC